MKKLLPFLFLFAGVFAVFAVLFLLTRTAKPAEPEIAVD
jgi:formate-dependent nitrite reductase membrane component NrfD